uniref:Uncharacterized protein n=1 Tax=Pipistrellus kuhlii TaxID=59472 RepID=A0A7J8B2H0_PIPKU|nr:hypothetical protein mPipKuh1_007761 [Pipistrellus kuhlii]
MDNFLFFFLLAPFTVIFVYFLQSKISQLKRLLTFSFLLTEKARPIDIQKYKEGVACGDWAKTHSPTPPAVVILYQLLLILAPLRLLWARAQSVQIRRGGCHHSSTWQPQPPARGEPCVWYPPEGSGLRKWSETGSPRDLTSELLGPGKDHRRAPGHVRPCLIQIGWCGWLTGERHWRLASGKGLWEGYGRFGPILLSWTPAAS